MLSRSEEAPLSTTSAPPVNVGLKQKWESRWAGTREDAVQGWRVGVRG